MVRMTPNIEGAVLMTASMASFTINDTFFKLLSEDLPFYQVLFLRSLGATLILFYLAWRRGVLTVPTRGSDRKLILVRTLAEVFAAYFFLTALVHLPIANVTAIIQALPLTVTLGAALVLREAVGWRRVLAILIGLVGVLMIVRPGGADFTLYTLYAVMAVICVTIRDLTVRRMSDQAHSLMIAFVAVLGVLVFSALGAVVTEWRAMAAPHLGYLAGSMLFILGGYLFSVMAMRVGEVGFVSQFRYASLLAALILGLVVFGDWPDSVTLAGAAIVVATGLFTLWRERRVD